MSPHIDLDLPEYLLGLLDEDQAARVRAHIGRCPRCAQQLPEAADALAAFGCSRVDGSSPPGELRARILLEVRSCRYRLAPLAPRLAQVTHIALCAAQKVLARALGPEGWEASPWSDIEMMHVSGADNGEVGLLRVAPGAELPFHTNTSDETFMVLDGELCEHDGHVLCRGAVESKPVGTAHGFRAGAAQPLLAAVVVRGATIAGHGSGLVR